MKNLSLLSIILLALNYGYSQGPKLNIVNSGTAVFRDEINKIDSAVIDQNSNHLIYEYGSEYSNLPISSFDSITFSLPVNMVLTLSDITATTVYCHGQGFPQSSNPYSNLTAFGICWSTSSFPTIPSINKIPGSLALGYGSVWSIVFGLQPSTTYHFRLYAIYLGVTYYGHETIITTLPPCALPTVTTNPVTSITYNLVTGGGNVTSQGCSPVEKRGVWIGLSNPPLAGMADTVGGAGAFTVKLAVSPSSKYYVRAYAKNDGGYAFGNVDSFSTPAAPPPPGKIEFYCTGQAVNGISVGINIYDSPSYSNQVASGCIIAVHPLGQQINCQNAPTDYIATLPAGTYYFKAFDLNGSVCDSGPIVIVANGCSGKNVAAGYQVVTTPCSNCYCHH